MASKWTKTAGSDGYTMKACGGEFLVYGQGGSWGVMFAEGGYGSGGAVRLSGSGYRTMRDAKAAAEHEADAVAANSR